MPGYADRFKTLNFPELGDDLWVVIRNPKTMSPSKLRPQPVPLDAQGNPIDQEQAEQEMFRVLATLVKDWHVYDATSDDDDQPVLNLPATADSVSRLPLAIINGLAEELASAVNPK